MPRPEKVRLGEILLQQSCSPSSSCRRHWTSRSASGRKLGRVFVEKGFVSEEQISTALARQLQVPYVNLKHFIIKPEVAMRLPETQARRFRALVLEDAGAFYRVAMADPTDLFAYDEVVPLPQARDPARGGHRDRCCCRPSTASTGAPSRSRGLAAGAGPGARRRRRRFRRARGLAPRSRTRRSCACCRPCSRMRSACAPPTSTSSRRKPG